MSFGGASLSHDGTAYMRSLARFRCLLAEMLFNKPILPGKCEMEEVRFMLFLGGSAALDWAFTSLSCYAVFLTTA